MGVNTIETGVVSGGSAPPSVGSPAAGGLSKEEQGAKVDGAVEELAPKDLVAAVLAELFGDDGEDLSAARRAEVGAQLDATGGDLTLGEIDARGRDDLSLEGLGKEIDEYSTHEIVRGILQGGAELRSYATDVENRLRQVELDSIEDYMAESDNLLALHQQIRDCDRILAAMEALLGGFQADLGNISSEIKHLQEQSLSMSIKLRNRKAQEMIWLQAAAQQLATFVGEVVISPELIENIMESQVTEDYLEFLVSLNKKLAFVRDSPLAAHSAALRDVEGELERLRAKAVGKVRDFLMQRFYALRKPKTNVQILQQNVLLKFRYFAQFLASHGQEVYPEVRGAYVETMSKILSAHFRTYIAALSKLQMDIASKNDLVGVDESKSGGGVFGVGRGGKDALKNRTTVFSLGERAAILKDMDAAAVVPHMAEAAGQKFPYEVLFRSANKLLMDTATSEYLFCCDFFGLEQGALVFRELFFQGPLAVVEEHLAAVLPHYHDAIGLLLIIRMTHHNQVTMQRRRVPILDPYFDKVNMLVWPRFKAVFDLHLASIRDASARRLFNGDIHPHYVTRRYAELTASLIQLNMEYGEAQMDANLDRLRLAMDDLLLKMSLIFPVRKNQIIFLINNYDVILSVFKASSQYLIIEAGDAGGFGPHQRHLDELVRSYTNLFVEEQLGELFGPLVAFVKRAEAELLNSNIGMQGSQTNGAAEGNTTKDAQILTSAGFGLDKAEPLLKEFARTWKGAIEGMHRDVMTYFSNFICGMEILKATLTQLLLYYTRLLQVAKRAGGGAPLSKDVVTIPSIMYEIKKYSRTF
eukprot:jgi/Chlat1/1494/Chrsp12S02039